MNRQTTAPLKEVAGYLLAEKLGAGGMGDVYKAYHPGLDRHAAVKILHQPTLGERFRNEAFIQSSVNHPNIVRLYESRLTGPHPAIVMEYVSGECLDQRIRRLGKISSEETQQILTQIVSALAYLHERDILHRDIKPSNFKIAADGTVKMLDFGIAKHKYTPKLTQHGFVVGTTEYMAPEQFAQRVEKQSDIWSLGVMIYEMTTGHLPFEAPQPILLQAKICKAQFTDPMILVTTLSPKIAGIIESCLRISPSSRDTAIKLRKKLKEDKPGTRSIRLPVNMSVKDWLLTAMVILGAVTMFNIIRDDKDEPISQDRKEKPALENQHRVRINTPNIPGAKLQLPDGEQRGLPTDIFGEEGKAVEFVLRADGYAERKVNLTITGRRNAYDFNLDKLND